ncbi:MAG: cytochrome P450 [Chryseosolibacter sp.]
MKNYKLPDGYTLLQSFARTYKQVKDPIGSMEESMAKYNGTYAVNLGTRRMIATQDPEFIEYVLKTNHKNYYKSTILTEQLGRFLGKGLLTSNGEYWLKQRRLIQPGFHPEKIHALYGIIKRTVDQSISDFPTGDNVDVYPLMNNLAFEIVINTLFNVKVPPGTRNELSRFITDTQDFVIKDIRQPHKSWWFTLSGEVKKNLEKAGGARQIIRSIIRTRKESGQKFDDLLDMLLDARYEDTGLPMEETQVIDEILILLIAGHETTANALSWTLYLLANHPGILHKLRTATQHLGVDETVSHDYLNAVIRESMRLYPPAWISDRVALHDDAFGQFTFPKDTIVILFYYGLHRDERYWENPTAFMPDRFLKDKGMKEKTKIYFPFGAGPRLCIGNNFAMAEMTLFLQAMIRRFDILPTRTVPGLKPLVTLRPDRVILAISDRQQAVQ